MFQSPAFVAAITAARSHACSRTAVPPLPAYPVCIPRMDTCLVRALLRTRMQPHHTLAPRGPSECGTLLGLGAWLWKVWLVVPGLWLRQRGHCCVLDQGWGVPGWVAVCGSAPCCCCGLALLVERLERSSATLAPGFAATCPAADGGLVCRSGAVCCASQVCPWPSLGAAQLCTSGGALPSVAMPTSHWLLPIRCHASLQHGKIECAWRCMVWPGWRQPRSSAAGSQGACCWAGAAGSPKPGVLVSFITESTESEAGSAASMPLPRSQTALACFPSILPQPHVHAEVPSGPHRLLSMRMRSTAPSPALHCHHARSLATTDQPC